MLKHDATQVWAPHRPSMLGLWGPKTRNNEQAGLLQQGHSSGTMQCNKKHLPETGLSDLHVGVAFVKMLQPALEKGSLGFILPHGNHMQWQI